MQLCKCCYTPSAQPHWLYHQKVWASAAHNATGRAHIFPLCITRLITQSNAKCSCINFSFNLIYDNHIQFGCWKLFEESHTISDALIYNDVLLIRTRRCIIIKSWNHHWLHLSIGKKSRAKFCEKEKHYKRYNKYGTYFWKDKLSFNLRAFNVIPTASTQALRKQFINFLR